jgi:hypothetical protein
MPHDQIFGEIFQAIKSATSDLNVPDQVVSEATGAALAVIIHHEHTVEFSHRESLVGTRFIASDSSLKEGIHPCLNHSGPATS